MALPRHVAGQFRLVSRPRLLRRLSGTWKVAILSAPAGYGKTTLAAQFTERRRSVWCRLHREDGDPAHLLRTIGLAVSGLSSAAGRRMAPLLVSLRDMDRDGGLLTAMLLRALEPERGTSTVVLDDLHRVAASRPSLQWVSRLIEESGPRVRFLITVRGDCPLPLTRLALKGRVIALRAEDLELLPSEQLRLLRDVFRLRLSRRERMEWSRALGGWAAGWILAAQKRREMPSPLLPAPQSGGATPSQVFAFLAEEVLSTFPEPLQQALVRASLLEDLDGDALRLLLGPRDARRLLDGIVHHGLLLQTLPDAGGGPRFHPLFRSFLRERFETTTSARQRSLLLNRLAHFHGRRGQNERAIRVLADAGDATDSVRRFEKAAARARASALLDALALDLLAHPRVGGAATDSPWVLLSAARHALQGSNAEIVLRRLHAAQELFIERQDLEGMVRAARLEARQTWTTGRIAEASARLESLLRRLPSRARRARGSLLLEIGELELQAGRPADARRTILRGEALLRGNARPEEQAETRLALARVAFTEGRWDLYLTDARRALTLYRRIGLLARVQSLLINMGEACTYQGEEDRAIAHLDEAALLHEHTQLHANRALASIGLGRASSEKGDARAAERHFAMARDLLRGRDVPMLRLQLDVWEGLHLRRLGRRRQAKVLLDRAVQGFERHAVPSWLNLARMERALLAGLDGQVESASRELRETAEVSRQLGDQKELARNLLYQARLLQHAGRNHAEPLRRALSILEAEDYLVLLRKVQDVAGPLLADGAPTLSAESRARALAAVPKNALARRPARPRHARAGAMPGGAAATLSIRMLGGFEVLASGVPVTFPRRAAGALVAYLALRRGKPAPVETLAETLWPEASPGSGRNRFDVTLNAARRALEPGAGVRGPFQWLRTDGGWCRLEMDGAEIDAIEFEARARSCESTMSRLGGDEIPKALARRAAQLHESLQVYGGDLLPAMRDVEWVLGERERLRDLAMRLTLALGAASASLRRADETEQAAMWVLAADPLHEEAHRLRLRALALRKDRAGLLRAHERFVRLVEEELETSPAPETVALYEELVRRLSNRPGR